VSGNDIEIRSGCGTIPAAGSAISTSPSGPARPRQSEGEAAGRGLSNGIGRGQRRAVNKLGMFACVGSFGNLAGLPAILANIAGAALLVPGAISVAAAAIGTFQLA
jgi:hypothetical protein